MPSETEKLHQQVDTLQKEVAALRRSSAYGGVRKRSDIYVGGWPLYDIAIGPDSSKGERRGIARGIFALGDIAIGAFAVGGLAVGLFSVGGCTIGVLFGLGGVSAGALAVGGVAIGGFALGGAAIGAVAVGGAAIGYYACGGGAIGKYVISGMHQDPEALRFFQQWFPGIENTLKPPGK